jgi:hypothetical protein
VSLRKAAPAPWLSSPAAKCRLPPTCAGDVTTTAQWLEALHIAPRDHPTYFSPISFSADGSVVSADPLSAVAANDKSGNAAEVGDNESATIGDCKHTRTKLTFRVFPGAADRGVWLPPDNSVVAWDASFIFSILNGVTPHAKQTALLSDL